MDDAIDAALTKLLGHEEIQKFINDNPSKVCMPVNQAWEEKNIPHLMQTPVQLAKDFQ